MKTLSSILLGLFCFVVPMEILAQQKSDEELASMISEEDLKAMLDKHAKEDLKNQADEILERRVVSELLMKYNPDIDKYKNLELVPDQVAALKKLQADYNTTLATIRTEKVSTERLARERKLKLESGDKIKKILLKHQMKFAKAFVPGNFGVAKSLVNTGLGDVLELSEKQKSAIESRADELAKKIHDFVHETRMESYEIIKDELTKEQLEKLTKFYGEDKFKYYFETNDVGTIFKDSLFDSSLIPEVEKFPTPGHSLLRTKIQKSNR